MVVSPILRGMFGLFTDTQSGTLTFAPHVPANWRAFSIRGVHLGRAHVDLSFLRSAEAITLEMNCAGASSCPVQFEPALSLRAELSSADLNGKALAVHLQANDEDQHAQVRVSAPAGRSTLRLRVRHDFGVVYEASLPALGRNSQGMRILSETWSAGRDALTMEVAGASGSQYELAVWNPSEAATVEGGEMIGSENGLVKVKVGFPPGAGSGEYTHGKIIFHFPGKPGAQGKR
jgi:hypothetical protein